MARSLGEATQPQSHPASVAVARRSGVSRHTAYRLQPTQTLVLLSLCPGLQSPFPSSPLPLRSPLPTPTQYLGIRSWLREASLVSVVISVAMT